MLGSNGVLVHAATNGSECGEKTVAKKRLRHDAIKPKQLKQLVEQQFYRCALTGMPLQPSTCNVDHVVPLSRGGEHTINNAQVILDYVNKAKGQMTNDEFIAMCCAVAINSGQCTQVIDT